MNSTGRFNYLHQLSDVYNHVSEKGPNEIIIDNEFTDKVFDLLELKEIAITEISRYCIDEHDAIARAFHSFSSKEIEQPASLVLFYYIEYYSNFIEANWPFSVKLFREYKLALGLSGIY